MKKQIVTAMMMNATMIVKMMMIFIKLTMEWTLFKMTKTTMKMSTTMTSQLKNWNEISGMWKMHFVRQKNFKMTSMTRTKMESKWQNVNKRAMTNQKWKIQEHVMDNCSVDMNWVLAMKDGTAWTSMQMKTKSGKSSICTNNAQSVSVDEF